MYFFCLQIIWPGLGRRNVSFSCFRKEINSCFGVISHCLTLCFIVGAWEETTKHSASCSSFKTSVYCVFRQIVKALSMQRTPTSFSACGDSSDELQLLWLHHLSWKCRRTFYRSYISLLQGLMCKKRTSPSRGCHYLQKTSFHLETWRRKTLTTYKTNVQVTKRLKCKMLS